VRSLSEEPVEAVAAFELKADWGGIDTGRGLELDPPLGVAAGNGCKGSRHGSWSLWCLSDGGHNYLIIAGWLLLELRYG
jgi:hypothetical protein